MPQGTANVTKGVTGTVNLRKKITGLQKCEQKCARAKNVILEGGKNRPELCQKCAWICAPNMRFWQTCNKNAQTMRTKCGLNCANTYGWSNSHYSLSSFFTMYVFWVLSCDIIFTCLVSHCIHIFWTGYFRFAFRFIFPGSRILVEVQSHNTGVLPPHSGLSQRGLGM